MKITEAKEIRNIIDDINKTINESYTFGKSESHNLKEFDNEQEDVEDNDYEQMSMVKEQEPVNVNAKEKIKQIRKIAIGLILELDPSSNESLYKSVKNIWDSCDKLLTKDTNKEEKYTENE